LRANGLIASVDAGAIAAAGRIAVKIAAGAALSQTPQFAGGWASSKQPPLAPF
jgi:hypothetical protein